MLVHVDKQENTEKEKNPGPQRAEENETGGGEDWGGAEIARCARRMTTSIHIQRDDHAPVAA
jgi:hypothetical protein